MPTPVSLFNTSAPSVTVSVNNGPQFSIPGVYGPGFNPQSSNGGTTWSNNYPAPNCFAPGNNFVNITAAGSIHPQMVQVSLPNHIQWMSLQVYVILNGSNQAGVLVLNNGMFVSGFLP